MKRNKNVLSLLIINFFTFLVLFVVVEGALRIVGIPYKVKYIPNENSFARFDPELGWSYLPDKSTILKIGNITKPVHFDENGIRVPNSGFQFNYFRPSVLFIGGSFTMGHGLSYEESFVGRFDAMEEIPYQIVNLGVQGYGTDQALLALKRHFSKFNPKVVVYTFIEDHILRNGNYDRRILVPTAKFLGTKPQFQLNNNKELFLARTPLLYKDYINSYLIDLLKIRTGKLFGYFPPYPEDLTKAIIQEMKEYSNKHNAHFIVLNWRWTNEDYDRLLQDLDINMIDTMEDAPDGWEEMVILNGVHPTAEASDHAARLLLNYFQNKDLLLQ